MKKFLLFIIFFFTLLPGTARAQDEANLKTIMGTMETDMEMIVRALNYDDFQAIETHATNIADHDKPPAEQMKKIIAFLGTDAPDFKKHDSRVHNMALKLKDAAAQEDYILVSARYSLLLGGCVACHNKYRAKIVEHLEE